MAHPPASGAHVGPLPVQCSAGAQAPAAGRHSKVAGWKPSAGQSLPTPSQVSPTSQTPAAARHRAGLLGSAGEGAAPAGAVSGPCAGPGAGPALGGGGLEAVGRTIVADPVAALGDVAHAGGGAALGGA